MSKILWGKHIPDNTVKVLEGEEEMYWFIKLVMTVLFGLDGADKDKHGETTSSTAASAPVSDNNKENNPMNTVCKCNTYTGSDGTLMCAWCRGDYYICGCDMKHSDTCENNPLNNKENIMQCNAFAKTTKAQCLITEGLQVHVEKGRKYHTCGNHAKMILAGKDVTLLGGELVEKAQTTFSTEGTLWEAHGGADLDDVQDDGWSVETAGMIEEAMRISKHEDVHPDPERMMVTFIRFVKGTKATYKIVGRTHITAYPDTDGVAEALDVQDKANASTTIGGFYFKKVSNHEPSAVLVKGGDQSWAFRVLLVNGVTSLMDVTEAFTKVKGDIKYV